MTKYLGSDSTVEVSGSSLLKNMYFLFLKAVLISTRCIHIGTSYLTDISVGERCLNDI